MTLEDIRKEIESSLDFSLSEVNRQRKYVYARCVYFKLSRELCPLESLESIGSSVNKDHASVLHGINNVFPSLEAYEESFYDIYTQAKSNLLDKYGACDNYASQVNPIAFLGVHKQYSNELSKYRDSLEELQGLYDELLISADFGDAIEMIKRVPVDKYETLLVRLDAITKIMAL